MLVSGFPVHINLRADFARLKHLLLCLEEGSVVQHAEGNGASCEAEMTSVLDSVQRESILFDPTGPLRFIKAAVQPSILDWTPNRSIRPGRHRGPGNSGRGAISHPLRISRRLGDRLPPGEADPDTTNWR